MFGFRFYLYSMLIHAAVLAAMMYTVDWRAPSGIEPAPPPNALQARQVDKEAVDAEIERMQRRETAKAEAMRKQLAELENEQRKVALKTEAQQQATERLLRQARKEAAAEAERVAKLQRQQREEARRLAKLKAAQATEAERKKALKAEQARLRKEAAALAEKRKREQKRLAEIEARKKAEEKRKREAAEAERRRKAEALALQAEWRAEKQALARQRAGRLSRLRLEYQSLIQQKVARNWIKRPDFDKHWACKIRVIQNVAGDVVRVEPVSCDGTTAYRASVARAVHRASPLPKPPSPDVFEREIIFNFKEQ